MNEHQPTEHHARHEKDTFKLDGLPEAPADALVAERWEEGLKRWGAAFAAFLRLGEPTMHTPDVLVAFTDLYVANFDSIRDCLNEQLDAMGWPAQLEQFGIHEGIPNGALTWDYAALEQSVREVYDLIEEDGRIYVFAR